MAQNPMTEQEFKQLRRFINRLRLRARSPRRGPDEPLSDQSRPAATSLQRDVDPKGWNSASSTSGSCAPRGRARRAGLVLSVTFSAVRGTHFPGWGRRMAEFWIYLFGSACTLHCAISIARLLRSPAEPGLRARDAAGRSRLLRIDRRRERRGRRTLDARAARNAESAADYSSAEASWTTARLRPECLAA